MFVGGKIHLQNHGGVALSKVDIVPSYCVLVSGRGFVSIVGFLPDKSEMSVTKVNSATGNIDRQVNVSIVSQDKSWNLDRNGLTIYYDSLALATTSLPEFGYGLVKIDINSGSLKPFAQKTKKIEPFKREGRSCRTPEWGVRPRRMRYPRAARPRRPLPIRGFCSSAPPA